jgi:hypothetical protein
MIETRALEELDRLRTSGRPPTEIQIHYQAVGQALRS